VLAAVREQGQEEINTMRALSWGANLACCT
jgi:hypothetical protein